MTTQEQIQAKCERLTQTLLAKNADYGNSALTPPFFMDYMSPSSAIAVRAGDKVARLRNLLSTSERFTDETIDDTILDLAGYCILWLCALENERRPTEQETTV